MPSIKKNKQQYRRPKRDVHGIILLDKPSGITSNQALNKVKYALQAKKAGHTGSLDPLASGLLPLCFGEATKVSQYLLESDKTYEVVAKLGEKTDTADSDGEVIESSEIPELTKDQVLAVLESFLGKSEQIPPMYSALKKDGKRLYELARQGKTVERSPRKIHISKLELLDLQSDHIKMRATVSKGTYIRSLVEDIAAALGTLAHVSYLRRIGVYPLLKPEMITLDEFEALTNKDSVLNRIDEVMTHWETIVVSDEQVADLRQGRKVYMDIPALKDKLLIKDLAGNLVALGQAKAFDELSVKRLINTT